MGLYQRIVKNWRLGCVKAQGFNDRKARCIALIQRALRSLNRGSFQCSPIANFLQFFDIFKIIALTLACAACFSLDKEHIIYLMQSKEVDAAITLYEEYKKEIGRHDSEVLVQMASVILEDGIRSTDPNIQLSSLYGTAIANINSSLHILEQGIKSQNFETQVASIRLLAHMHDDHADDLLTKAMSSPFLMARMEAGYYLAQTKHRKATGHIEALMYKLPQEFWVYFPQFYAIIGTHDSIEMLKKLMEEPFSMTRVEAILCAARFGRDDLLPKIRAHSTHPHQDEQEATAAALGYLKDSKSIPQLKKLANSNFVPVKLAALRSLYHLGDTHALLPIFDLAKQHEIFAIALLGELPGGEDVLASLLPHSNIHVRFNAALSLLQRRDSRCISALEEFLHHDTKDLGFQPYVSVGHSMQAWKVVPSLEQRVKDLLYDVASLSIQLREFILTQCLELPEHDFLKIAEKLFKQRELDLIPLLVQLLENHHTEDTIKLLKKHAEHAGAPLIRMYCNLSLYRLKEKGPYEERLRHWISKAQTQEKVKFRSSVPWYMRKSGSPHEIAPEEGTRLLLEAYQALADRHEENGIDIILQGIKEGHRKNRYALAGLLIHTLQ